MIADTMAPCVARLLASMMLTMWGKQVLALHEEEFQLPVPCQCGVMA